MLYRMLLFFTAITIIGCNQNTDTKNEAVADNFGLQKIVVSTANWSDTKGTMTMMERTSKGAPWTIVDSFQIIVGRNGLAFDEQQQQADAESPLPKREGDGCSPAGTFSLGKIFSYHALTDLRMPFQQVGSTDLCVDDVKSKYYNTLINDSLITEKDYNSFEHMLRDDHQYEYGVWVNYNTYPQVAGNGSCIFLHIYQTPETPTSGCTAMSKANMIKLIYWLDANKQPMLIQGVNAR